jgi:hypothetical protein
MYLHKLSGFIVIATIGCAGRVSPEASPSDDASVVADGAVVSDSPDIDGSTPMEPCVSGDCVLVPRACCLGCGAMAAPSEFHAILKSAEANYMASVCAAGDCPTCRPSTTRVAAMCRFGKCQVVDLSNDEITRCATKDDCLMRYQYCCGPCEPSNVGLIAIRRDQNDAYSLQVCGSPPMSCACLSPLPDTHRAGCDVKTRHCIVEPAGSTL